MDAALGEAWTERLELDEGPVPMEGVFMLTFSEKPEDAGELDMRISMSACSRLTAEGQRCQLIDEPHLPRTMRVGTYLPGADPPFRTAPSQCTLQLRVSVRFISPAGRDDGRGALAAASQIQPSGSFFATQAAQGSPLSQRSFFVRHGLPT